MLTPKKLKHRKSHRFPLKRQAKGGSRLVFGSYGIMATQCGRINSRQIESARIAMTREIKRDGKVWIKIFPHIPVTRKPLEVRMGKGKGAVDHYVANIEPGRILYEMSGVEVSVATRALSLAAAKLPIRTRIIIKGSDKWES